MEIYILWCSVRAIAFLFSNLIKRKHESTKTKTRKHDKNEKTQNYDDENKNSVFDDENESINAFVISRAEEKITTR